MPREGYTAITVKDGLVTAIDRFIATNSVGFTSRAEVVSTAVREFLRDHEAAARHSQDEHKANEDRKPAGED